MTRQNKRRFKQNQFEEMEIELCNFPLASLKLNKTKAKLSNKICFLRLGINNNNCNQRFKPNQWSEKQVGWAENEATGKQLAEEKIFR